MSRTQLLIILDGWGLREEEKSNAVCQSYTPILDRLFEEFPWSRLKASGRDVGLPESQQGNSEVGHLNLGAGRIVDQDLVRIDKAVEEKTLQKIPTLQKLFRDVIERGAALHLLGLVSDGGVHSHQKHLVALLHAAKEAGVQEVYIHAFLDGRDVPPRSAYDYVRELEEVCEKNSFAKIASISGRYYAMDRDKRFDRVKKAWEAIIYGEAPMYKNALSGIQRSYEQDISDEFVIPFVIEGEEGEALAPINEDDGILFFNFRADRARELAAALAIKDFEGFDRGAYRVRQLVSLTEYDARFNDEVDVVFAAEGIPNTLGAFLSKHSKKQIRIAETEKYAHVTFFFNGGVEEPYPGEDRVLIPSPKVATYDLQPEMHAERVADEVQQTLLLNQHDFILVNFANPDMVGHTGIFSAARQAMEAVDRALGKVLESAEKTDACVLITADHGNCEQMAQTDGSPHTSHTTNPVAILMINGPEGIVLKDGRLSDVAPTVLDLMKLEKPVEMTGESLLISKEEDA